LRIRASLARPLRLVVAGHDRHGPEFEPLGEVHGAEGDVPAGGLDVAFHVRHFRAQQAVTSATASRLNSGVYRLLEIGEIGVSGVRVAIPGWVSTT